MADIKTAAIYHFTNHSERRPVIYLKQLDALKEYAESKGFIVADIFCDKTLRRCEQTEFKRLLPCSDQFDVLVAKNFYHINKRTNSCIATLLALRDHGVTTYTMENGVFTLEETPLDKPLRVVTYNSRFGTLKKKNPVIPLQDEIMRLFVSKKTNWNIVAQYHDESYRQLDSEQINLAELIKHKDEYDLILLHTFSDLHWRTANFCKYREKLQLDIYSLQEGFLKYRKE